MNFKGEQYLLEKDRTLHQKGEVKFLQNRKIVSGGDVHTKPIDKIADWLDTLEQTHLNHQPENPIVLDRIKKYYHKVYIHPYQNEITLGAARVEGRAARQLGYGDIRYEGDALDERRQIAVEDLEKSLDLWVDYLSNPSEPYPTWFRYYVFTNVTKMGSYDFDKQEFRKRGKDTFFPFPDIDRSALGYIRDLIECSKDSTLLENYRNAQSNPEGANTPSDLLLTREYALAFANKSFPDQYAEAIKSRGEITPKMREETKGTWKSFSQGTSPDALWASLQNKGVPWCTRGYATARTQLEGGDFHVYYTIDKQGMPLIPRIAIRMDHDRITGHDRIGEVRGVADNSQNLEKNMIDIAADRIQELPGAEMYLKATQDMKRLTAIENIIMENGELSKDDLKFLYEIDQEIDGFGYDGKDPRIFELQSARKESIREDFAKIYEVDISEVVMESKEINENTVICLDVKRVDIKNLSRKSTKLKVLRGGINGRITENSRAVLENLRVIDGYKAISFFINRLTQNYEDSAILSDEYLAKVSQGLEAEPEISNIETSLLIELAITSCQNSGDESLKDFMQHLFCQNKSETGRDISESDYFYMNLLPQTKSKIFEIIQAENSLDLCTPLYIYILNSERVISDDCNTILSILKNAPQEVKEKLPISKSDSSRKLVKNLNRFPDIVEFIVDQNITSGIEYLEINHIFLKGRSQDIYSEYFQRDINEDMLLGKNTLSQI
ncbi:hypothetical protein KA111_01915 [Candidatus Woesebacteria bacterium]|nr:hypothetical protein [Candidatus Woesebacteria bacterium]